MLTKQARQVAQRNSKKPVGSVEDFLYKLVCNEPVGEVAPVVRAEATQCLVRMNMEVKPMQLCREVRPVVGDEVEIDILKNRITRFLPRRTQLARPQDNDPTLEKAVAANIDLAAVVVSVGTPPLHPRLIDRYLFAIHKGGASPLIVVNKLDLLSEMDVVKQLDQLEPYRSMGIPTVNVSATLGRGLDMASRLGARAEEGGDCGAAGDADLARKPGLARTQAGAPAGAGRRDTRHARAHAGPNPAHVPNRARDPFAIFYTSGSTGQPKGVLSTHDLVNQMIWYMTNVWYFSHSDRISLFTSVCFLVAYPSFLGALLNGGTLCMLDLKTHSAQAALDWIVDTKLTVFRSTPSIFRTIFGQADPGRVFPLLRLLTLGGEPVNSGDIELFKAHTAEDCVLIRKADLSNT